MGERKLKTKKAIAEETRKERAEIKQKAYDMYVFDKKSKIDICVELGVSRPTLNGWLENMGARDSKQIVPLTEEDKHIGHNVDKFLDAAIQGKIPSLRKKAPVPAPPAEVLDARVLEKAKIAQTSESNMTPGERYAAYVAAQGVRMMRDAIPNIRMPTTVKELEILDGIVRRHLGLDKKTGAILKIDVNILNNSKASPKGAVIDVEPK
jgi:hypothetical protein